MRSLGQFILFLTIALAIVAAWQFYIWTRLVRDPAWPEPYARIATVLLVLVTVLPPIVVFTSRYLPRAVVKGFAVSLYTWFGMAFLLGLAFFAADLARWIVRGIAALAGNAPPHDPERRQLVARTVAEAAGLGVAALGAVSVRSALADVGVEEVDVRLARLPRALSGLTIVQLTDIHIGPTIGRKFLEHVVEKSNAQKPDAIVITGDLVDGSVASLRSHVEPLSKLEARYGVYFVTGNHEYYSGVEEWMAELERLGVRVLRNERVTLGDRTASIDLAGVDATLSVSSFCWRTSRARSSTPLAPEWAFNSPATRTAVRSGRSAHWFGSASLTSQAFTVTMLLRRSTSAVAPVIGGLPCVSGARRRSRSWCSRPREPMNCEAELSNRRTGRAAPGRRLRHLFVGLRAGGARTAQSGAAVRAPIHLLRIRGVTRRAVANRSRLAVVHVGIRVHLAEHELLRSNTNAIAVRQFGRLANVRAVDPAPVAAPEILEKRAVVIGDDARVSPRDRGIEDRNVAVVPATDERAAHRQIVLLQEKPEPISPTRLGTIGFHGDGSTTSSPPNATPLVPYGTDRLPPVAPVSERPANCYSGDL